MGGRASWQGGIGREELEALLAEGLTVRAMAERLGLSYTTIRYWLGRYGLQTPRGARLAATRAARLTGASELVAACEIHGSARLVERPGGGFRCRQCRNAAVLERRRKVKELLVAEAGGACATCGYSTSVAALHFHHLDPTTKGFAISGRGVTRSLERARAEAAKCVLLCANCHAEVEVGVRQVPCAGDPVGTGIAHPG